MADIESSAYQRSLRLQISNHTTAGAWVLLPKTMMTDFSGKLPFAKNRVKMMFLDILTIESLVLCESGLMVYGLSFLLA